MARNFRLEVSRTAERQLAALPRDDQIRVSRVIQHLAEEPRPVGTRKLSGYSDVYRIRVGHYRIIYSVEDDRLLIIVLKIGHRKDIYRSL